MVFIEIIYYDNLFDFISIYIIQGEKYSIIILKNGECYEK